MTSTPFTLALPEKRTSPVIFASPHSGRDYPQAFKNASVLDALALRSSEDAFVDQLFDSAPSHGVPLLSATLPRAYLDLNRGIHELDPALIKGVQVKIGNPRVSSGLGIIPRVVSAGRAIYRGKITFSDAQSRIRSHWHPYHAQLARLIHQSHAQFGQAILLDCHSMPHEAIQLAGQNAADLPEIILGDRFGASANVEIVDLVEKAFVDAGLRVARNKPFAGAYIAEAYGRPSYNQHVVQIEIDRALYLNDAEMRPNGNYKHLKTLLNRVINEITLATGKQQSLAAE